MRLRDILFGEPLASHEEGEQRVGTVAAIPMLGLDALGSAAYGPEAALTLLLPLGALGIAHIVPISTLIIALLLVVYLSYRQTIAAYPTDGGSYTVARRNLGVPFGLLAGAALLLDYVLVVAIGISAGIGALVSAVPALQPHTLALCQSTLALIAFVNLRGVRESGVAFILPTYLFVATLFVVLALGVARSLLAGGHPVAVAPPLALPAATATVSLWLLLQSFASGCTAMTGVETISNGVTAFREPRVVRAQRTLTIVIAILVVLLAGIAYLVRAYGIGATAPGQAGYVTIGSILAVLALSANTGFADFPRLCRVIAQDGYLPHSFASRGRRLVFSHGIWDYHAVACEVAQPRPLDVADLQEPIVVVPVSDWNRIASKALRFALKLSADIRAVHVRVAERTDGLSEQWPRLVEEPAASAGLPVPPLVVIDSPLRRTLHPIVDYVKAVRDENPGRQVAVLIPELVEYRWYQYLLHNQRAQALKAMLLLGGGQRVVVINVPWYLST